MKTVNNPSEFPNTEHYAIILFDKNCIHHEADQRSKDCPGHGYPAYTETVNNFKYISFDKTEAGKLEWELKVQSLYKDKPTRNDIVVFEAGAKASITTTVTIKS